MRRACPWVGLVVLAVAQVAGAQGGRPWTSGQPYYYGGYGVQPPSELTIEQQRKLGLSEEQIQKIAELRRDLEKERAKLDAQLKAASEAAATANAEVARVSAELRNFSTTKIVKIYESVMDEKQRKAWERQRYLDQAKQWLTGYKQWLKLTDAQVDDISTLLIPVFEKFGKMEDETTAAKDRLSEFRRADKIDIAAIDKGEKEVEELTKRNVWQQRQDELMDKMKAGLMPDQLEKLGQIHRRGAGN
jgi:cysteinyl-tRNA synthetase